VHKLRDAGLPTSTAFQKGTRWAYDMPHGMTTASHRACLGASWWCGVIGVVEGRLLPWLRVPFSWQPDVNGKACPRNGMEADTDLRASTSANSFWPDPAAWMLVLWAVFLAPYPSYFAGGIPDWMEAISALRASSSSKRQQLLRSLGRLYSYSLSIPLRCQSWLLQKHSQDRRHHERTPSRPHRS